MIKQYKLALHIFRRDLRLQDNTSLIEALNSSLEVIPCFIFDKRQIEKNEYKSNHCIQFMIHSLNELDAALRKKQSKLYYFYGIAEEVIEQLIKRLKIEAVFINRDYTPFSRKRDQHIERICVKYGIDFNAYADALLHEPEEIFKKDQTPYTVFSHFLQKAKQLTVAPVHIQKNDNYYQKSIDNENENILKKILATSRESSFIKGGRKEALHLLANLDELKNYNEIRNFPALNGTTKLSAHNKFGTISIREFYYAILKTFNKCHTLINELYWRDFFTHIAFHFPHVFNESFYKKYSKIKWSENNAHFEKWCEGKTGFPIVDAGMRELNTTGYMHNRVRMIVASFLTKDLHINWQWGEKYFAQQLIDYDPAVNNGNWQWAASTGCDAQPYFRIFNPWLQQKKFDADGNYIKKWLPELSDLPTKMLHELYKQREKLIYDYPLPMLDHSSESQKSKLLYKIKI